MPLTGIQIDAIYHTSLVFGNVEYFFGQGIHRTVPGKTHHGQPMEKLRMGRTELPMEVIQEYLESLAQIYTPEVRGTLNGSVFCILFCATDPD